MRLDGAASFGLFLFIDVTRGQPLIHGVIATLGPVSTVIASLATRAALVTHCWQIVHERERERELFGEHLSHPTLCIKPFVLLLIRCLHGTVLLDMVGLDRMAVGMDVNVAVGVE